MIQLRQDAMDAWAKGLQDELKELLVQAFDSETLAKLDGCDAHLKQVIRSSGRHGTKGQPEDLVPEDVHDWGSTIFGDGQKHIHPAALEAVTK
jgi:hypothetical protein